MIPPSDPPPATRSPARSVLASRRVPGFLAPLVALFALLALALLVAWLVLPVGPRVLMACAVSGALGSLIALVAVHNEMRGHRVADRELGNAQAWVSNIVGAAMDPIVTVDADQRIVVFNTAAEEAFRWSQASVLGQPLDMLIPERFRSAHRQYIEQFGKTGVTSRRMGSQRVLHALRADGEEFPIEASISQHESEGRRYFTVILRDVGERIRAEARLARSEARLRGILDSAMDAIITVDESQNVVLFNNAAEAMFAWPRTRQSASRSHRSCPNASATPTCVTCAHFPKGARRRGGWAVRCAS